MDDYDLNKHGGLDLMRAGAWHQPEHPAAARQRQDTAVRLREFNRLANSEPERARELLAELLGTSDATVTVNAPAQIEYGVNTHCGAGVFINFGVTILDSAEVRIGARTLIGPNCQLITVSHPVDDLEMRRGGWEQARPITLGEDVWLAAGVTVLPGVSIGDRAVIGAGSVVSRDIPADCVAMGTPARPLRQLDPERAERDQLPEGAPVNPWRA
ncbi:sugar O-acetyltransferase [Corynebacterium halotolerans]|uniref:sugar O-acetyltransferase n=1 Tax=Corynebacterium halotolerans TaxID=225326 RepID=UPI003CF05508